MGPNGLNGSKGIEDQTNGQQPPNTESNVNDQNPGRTSEQNNGFVFKGKTVDAKDVQTILDQVASDLGRASGENGYLRQQLAELKGSLNTLLSQQQQKPAEEQEAPDFEERFFKDPNQFFRQERSEIEKLIEKKAREIVEKEKAAMLAEQHREKASAQLWDEFYKKNPQLSTIRDYIGTTLVEQLRPEIATLPAQEALEVVARKAKEKLIEWGGKGMFNDGGQKPYAEQGNKVSTANAGLPKDPMTPREFHSAQMDAVNSISLRNRAPSTKLSSN